MDSFDKDLISPRIPFQEDPSVSIDQAFFWTLFLFNAFLNSYLYKNQQTKRWPLIAFSVLLLNHLNHFGFSSFWPAETFEAKLIHAFNYSADSRAVWSCVAHGTKAWFDHFCIIVMVLHCNVWSHPKLSSKTVEKAFYTRLITRCVIVKVVKDVKRRMWWVIQISNRLLCLIFKKEWGWLKFLWKMFPWLRCKSGLVRHTWSTLFIHVSH